MQTSPRRLICPFVVLALFHSTPAWSGAAEPPAPAAAQYRGATIELKTLLQGNPSDRDARLKLGLIELDYGRGPEAEKELRRAVELGAPAETAQIPLFESLLMQGKFQDLLDHRMPLDLLSGERQAALLAYRGEAWLGLNRPDKAQDEFNRALQLEPRSNEAKLGLARLAQSRQQFDEAGRLLAEVLAAVPDNAKAWSLQGSLFEATRRFEQAEESYGKAISLKKFSPMERASRALIRINGKRLEAARTDLDVLAREAPDFFLTLYAEGVMDLQMERYGEAQSKLENALKRNDRFNSINYYLGIAHFFQNHDHEAEKYLQIFSAYQPEVVEARLFLAVLKFRKGDHGEAREYLNTVLAKQPDNLPALKLMSDLEVLGGNPRKGLQYLRRHSELIGKRIQPGTRPLESANPADKIELLSGLDDPREIDPKLARSVTDLVLKHLRAGEFDQAKMVADKARTKSSRDPLGDHLTGLIYLARNQPDQARSAFEAALEKKPGDPVLTHRVARLAVREKDYEAARRLYTQALAREPRNLSFRMSLAELDGYEGKSGDMGKRLEEIIRDHPTDLEPRLTLASQLLNLGQPSRAQAVLEEIREGYPRNPALTTLLIKAQLENHQTGQALATAQAFVADDPESAMAEYLLASAYAQAQDKPCMRAALEKAIGLDPKFLPARYSFVKLLAAQNDLGRADAEIGALAREYPDNLEIVLLRAWMASAQGKFPEAVTAHQAAFDKAKTIETATGLAKARWQAGDRKGAIDLLEDWIKSHPDDALPRIEAADFLAAGNKPDQAIRHLEAVLKAHPDNILVMNNLAWLYRESAPGKALAAARRAASLAPHAPNVLDTLAMIELDRGDAQRAIGLLTHASELAPAQKPLRYHLALALDKAGKPREAIPLLKEILADQRAFPERKEAGALLERLSAD